MIRKLSKVFTLLLLLGCIGFAAPAWGAEKSVSTPDSITYEMKEITVQYAAEFTAYPLTADKTSVTKSVYESVYSNESKPLQVLYGVVKLTTMTGYTFTEEFIRVSDGTHFARGLSNGGSWFYNANNQVRGQDTEFVTGKKLEGSSSVKDYSDGWKTIRFSRSWDDYGNPMKLEISFKWDLKGTADPFFQKLTETEYQIDLSSLRHKGNMQAVKRRGDYTT